MSPAPTPPPDLLDRLAKGFDVKFSGQLPGEGAAIALINFATEVRGTMDKELLKRLDAITVQQLEDMQKVWRSLWKALGVV